MTLQTLGFSTFFEQQLQQTTWRPARITEQHKHMYRVCGEDFEWLATVSGSYAFHTHHAIDYPAIGDWVLVEQMPGEEKCAIHQLLTRKSVFTRKAAGREIEQQVVAANIDIILLAMSLNEDFNVRRLERYVVAAWESGAVPMIVLTKADMCDDIPFYMQQLTDVAMGIDCIVTSAITGEGIETLRQHVSTGKTAAIIGSSGAGKSSLTNALLGEETMKVADIRADDAKGRHTTTHRALIQLPNGACFIDTPGMRELHIWTEQESLNTGFDDIETFAASCRFRDCTHHQEPGCAVRQAIENGQLEAARLRNYVKLQKEVAFIERKTKAQEQLAAKRRLKKISKQLKAHYR
ncbi:ribosome small subunit-dependent GTPase A [Kurthia massiliensis]|uniref:ribosome small subunit-dependent GTPase A n=1 Tax=Kurthia massiliensis TaxID=1033739 RepID=UPI00028836B9|nr:ribosome small subunit-dependent GTPase A [Kurthia massiliensis]